MPWLEIGRATYKLEEDGETVQVFSASGYQRVKLARLPKEVREQILKFENSLDKKSPSQEGHR